MIERTGLGKWALAETGKSKMAAMSLGLRQGHRKSGHIQ